MLVWNVYVSNFNARKIEVYNIFDHRSFYNDCVRVKKKFGKDREKFAEEIRTNLMYFYWSKCEWEVILDHWPHRDNAKQKKIDVYSQVMINWDHFIEYLWNNRNMLKERE